MTFLLPFAPFPFGIFSLMATRRQADCPSYSNCPSYSDDGTQKKVCTALFQACALLRLTGKTALGSLFHCTALAANKRDPQYMPGLLWVNSKRPMHPYLGSVTDQYPGVAKVMPVVGSVSAPPDATARAPRVSVTVLVLVSKTAPRRNRFSPLWSNWPQSPIVALVKGDPATAVR